MENELKSMPGDITLLQNLQEIPAPAYAIALVIAFVAFGLIPIIVGFSLLVVGYVVWNNEQNKKALREAKARAATYANVHGPIVVYSILPDETPEQVQARCEVWREKLRLSGNPYAEKIPIIAFPYDPVLMDTGEFGGGWTIYEKRVSEMKHAENLRWHSGKCPAELKHWFASNVLPAPKNEFNGIPDR